MALSQGIGLNREGVSSALQRQLAPTGYIPKTTPVETRAHLGEWWCREAPPVRVSMLLTIKDLSEQLRIKPATLYSWAAQGQNSQS